jgi:hypothetical protein
MWVILACACVLGGITGYAATKSIKAGVFIVGLWLGFILTLAMNNLFLYKIHTDPVKLPFYICFAIVGMIAGISSVFVYKHVIILSTGICGAYGFVRGISLFAGHFPNEITVF